MLSPKTVLIIALSVIFLIPSFVVTLPNGKLHLVFCDVGQGDAAYIRGPEGSDIVIDGGPDARVLNCLGKHMPFYDRTIELLILSHPQADHLTGLIEILKYYKVLQIVDSSAKATSKEAQMWENQIKTKKIQKTIASQGESIVVDKNLALEIVWPPEIQSADLLADINLLSTVVFLKYQDFTALFTGDISKEVAEKLQISTSQPLTVLKVPHHGSKFGLSQKFLEAIQPRLAVISVGKNSFGHPSPQTLKLLNSFNIPIFRTDKNGDVLIKSNGQDFSVLNNK